MRIQGCPSVLSCYAADMDLGASCQGILLELPLAGFFLKKLLRRGCDLNDLPSLDAELYRSLLFLRDYDGDVEDLALTFTVTDADFGTNREVRLPSSLHDSIPSGGIECAVYLSASTIMHVACDVGKGGRLLCRLSCCRARGRNR